MARFKRRDLTYTIGGHAVRCVFDYHTGNLYFMIDRYRVPSESVDRLMIVHPYKHEQHQRGTDHDHT